MGGELTGLMKGVGEGVGGGGVGGIPQQMSGNGK